MGVILFLRHGRRKKKVPVYRLLEKSRKTTRNILAHPYTHELKGAPNGGGVQHGVAHKGTRYPVLHSTPVGHS